VSANTRKPSAECEEKARQLLQAITIHEDVVIESRAHTAAQKKLIRDGLARERDRIVSGDSKTLATLHFVEATVLRSFNESSGPDTEKFWERVANAGLAFHRRDVVREILDRNRIKDRIEYDAVIDTADLLTDAGKITAAEAKQLRQLVERYEADERP
jgi:hypothetical protein